MASYLDFEGKYDASRRFVVHNCFAEDFISFWDSKPINIKAGEMYECEHAIAFKLTKELVDREMFRLAEEEYRKSGDNKQFAERMRERAEMATLNKDLRKPFEDKVLSEIKAGEENPIMKKMRADIRAEIEAETSTPVPSTVPVEAEKTIAAPAGSLSNDKAVSNANSNASSAKKPARVGEFEE